MGLFGKKKAVETEETRHLNNVLAIALTFDQSTGTWKTLPEGTTKEVEDQVITARKMIFEYIRQLKEAHVYGNGAVHNFAKEQYSWVNKENLKTFIKLGQHL